MKWMKCLILKRNERIGWVYDDYEEEEVGLIDAVKAVYSP